MHDELDITENNWLPTVSNDGLELFYSGSTGGPNSFDVFTARRAAIGDRFSAPTRVAELSSTGDDVGLRLTPDGATLYLNFMALTSGGDVVDLHRDAHGANDLQLVHHGLGDELAPSWR